MGKLRLEKGNQLSKVPEWIKGRTKTRTRTPDHPFQLLFPGSSEREVQGIGLSEKRGG